MDEWFPIDRPPSLPMAVILYFPFYVEVYDVPSYRAEWGEIAFWDGLAFRENGTGHEVFESWRENSMLPTFWKPLGEPPKP